MNAARPGDTIAVGAGVYFENVTVPAGKDGLRIVGAGPRAAILDADAPNSGTGLRIESSGVEVARLGIRNGRQSGISIAGGLQDVSIREVRIIGVQGPAAIMAEAGTTGLHIVSNEICAAGFARDRAAERHHRAVVRGNVVQQVDRGIAIMGDEVRIASNEVSETNTFGISVQGEAPVVTGNTIDSSLYMEQGGRGVVVFGDVPTVRDNRLTNAGIMFVLCSVCAGGIVTGNSNIGAMGFDPWFGDAFRISTFGDGLSVDRNFVSRAYRSGFWLDGTGIVATNNVVIDSGTPEGGGNGFFVTGRGHRLMRNTITRASVSGFLISGEDITVEGNVSNGAGVNGFLVSGPEGRTAFNTLTGNRSLGSNAAGFAVVTAIGTRLSGNAASGNRYDFCDDGSGTFSTDNHFATTSTVCDVLQ